MIFLKSASDKPSSSLFSHLIATGHLCLSLRDRHLARQVAELESRVLSEFSEFLSTQFSVSEPESRSTGAVTATKAIQRSLVLTQLLSTLRYLDPKDLEEAFFSSKLFCLVFSCRWYFHKSDLFKFLIISTIVSVYDPLPDVLLIKISADVSPRLGYSIFAYSVEIICVRFCILLQLLYISWIVLDFSVFRPFGFSLYRPNHVISPGRKYLNGRKRIHYQPNRTGNRVVSGCSSNHRNDQPSDFRECRPSRHHLVTNS